MMAISNNPHRTGSWFTFTKTLYPPLSSFMHYMHSFLHCYMHLPLSGKQWNFYTFCLLAQLRCCISLVLVSNWCLAQLGFTFLKYLSKPFNSVKWFKDGHNFSPSISYYVCMCKNCSHMYSLGVALQIWLYVNGSTWLMPSSILLPPPFTVSVQLCFSV